MDNRRPVEPSRLLAAADVILTAEKKGETVTMWRDDAKPSKDGYSSIELVEALLFLQRLGLIDMKQNKPRRHPPSHP